MYSAVPVFGTKELLGCHMIPGCSSPAEQLTSEQWSCTLDHQTQRFSNVQWCWLTQKSFTNRLNHRSGTGSLRAFTVTISNTCSLPRPGTRSRSYTLPGSSTCSSSQTSKTKRQPPFSITREPKHSVPQPNLPIPATDWQLGLLTHWLLRRGFAWTLLRSKKRNPTVLVS